MKKSKKIGIFQSGKIPSISIDLVKLQRIGQSSILYLNNTYLYAPLLFYFLLIDEQHTVIGKTYRNGIFCVECNTDQFIEILIIQNPFSITEEIRFLCTQCKRTTLTCYYEFRSAIDIALLPTIKDDQIVISEDGRKLSYKIFREEILEKAQSIIYDPDISLSIKI